MANRPGRRRLCNCVLLYSLPRERQRIPCMFMAKYKSLTGCFLTLIYVSISSLRETLYSPANLLLMTAFEYLAGVTGASVDER